MDIRFSYKHMESSESLNERAEEKISRLIEKYLVNVTDVHVTFSVAHNEHLVDCHIAASGGVKVHSQGGAEHMYAALENLGDKLEAVLKKHKEKNKAKQHESIKDVPYDSILDEDYMEAKDVERTEKIRQVNHARLANEE